MSKYWNSLFALLLFTQALQVSSQVTSKRVEKKGSFIGLIHGGISTSQINGDGFGGYNKFSLNTGIGTRAQFSDKLKLQIELNYAGRGSRKRLNDPSSRPTSKFSLHYIDIPILFKFNTWKFEFEAGLCNSIYLSHREEFNFNRIPAKFNQWNFNRYEPAINLGVYVPINEQWKSNVRFHYSIFPASGGIIQFNGRYSISGLYNNVITFSVYRLIRGR